MGVVLGVVAVVQPASNQKIKNKLYIKKNTRIYGPNNVSGIVWALFCLCGPLLAVVGCCGPSWACVGLRWLLCDSLSRFTMLIAVVG